MAKIEYGRGGTIVYGTDHQRGFNTNNYATNYATSKPNYKTKITEETRKEMKQENAKERLNML